MGGFTFCCGDMGPAMEAKGTVTNEILEMIEDDSRVCYINADGTGNGGRVQQAQMKYPDRILDVGIQEMNMVTIAAGLAKQGYLPYVQTFGPFLCCLLYTSPDRAPEVQALTGLPAAGLSL